MAYHPRTIRVLALSQIFMGALMIVLGIASIFAVHHWSSYVGCGLWIGVWVLITGILGFVGAQSNTSPNKCLVGVFMGFAITGIVLASVMVIYYGIAVGEFSDRLKYTHYDYQWRRIHMDYYTAKNGAGLGSCLLILAMVEFFVALVSSIYCCNAVCCGPALPVPPTAAVNQQVVYMQQPGGYPGQVTILNPTTQTVQTTAPAMYVQGQPGYYVTPPGVPVQYGQQPAYWTAPTGTVPVSAAGAAAGQASFTTQSGQPVHWGGAPGGAVPPTTAGGATGEAHMTTQDNPPPYKQ